MQSWYVLHEIALERAHDLRAEAARDRLGRAVAGHRAAPASPSPAGSRIARARCWTVRVSHVSVTITLHPEVR